jgi:hypothetical protein
MLKFTDNVPLDIIAGKQLLFNPRLIINDTKMLMADAVTIEGVENDLLHSVGSVEDWLHLSGIDSYAFDEKSKILKLLFLSYPEQNKVPNNLNDLKKIGKVVGIPRLLNAVDFEIQSFEYRYYSIDNNLLLCFADTFAIDKSLIEVQIAEDVSLFFKNEQYCAWAVYNPELYIADNFNALAKGVSSSFLKMSFKKAFDLITTDAIDEMNDKDLSLLRRIASLHNEIQRHEEYPVINGLGIIKNWLYDVVDRFYSEREIQTLFEKEV